LKPPGANFTATDDDGAKRRTHEAGERSITHHVESNS
jgi:hypothetical protein